MAFFKILRNLIEERNLTQKQVANDLGIVVSTMGGYVQGSSEPDFETLKLFARYFGVTTDYLLNLRAEPAATDQEDELLRIFRSCSEEQRAIYLEQGRAILKYNLQSAAPRA